MMAYDEARVAFSTLLDWHLARGTRPPGSKKNDGIAWKNSEFARALRENFTPKAVLTWRTGKHHPRTRILDYIEHALFGNTVTGQYADWREDLRAAYSRKSDDSAQAMPKDTKERDPNTTSRDEPRDAPALQQETIDTDWRHTEISSDKAPQDIVYAGEPHFRDDAPRHHDVPILPQDFNLEVAKGMILSGRSLPHSWRPLIICLDLTKSKLEDLAPISTLPNLRTLLVSKTRVTDLRPLSNLPALEKLDLRDTPAIDLSPLAKIGGLQHLWIGDDAEHLYYRYSKISDITALSGLRQLRTLYMKNLLMADITPLRNLTNLEFLSIWGCRNVIDLEPIANLTGLDALDIGDTNISDLTPLRNMVDLRGFHFWGPLNELTDLAPLAGLRNLRRVNLTGAPLESLELFAAMTNLEELFLQDTKVSDLRPLANLKSLRVLDLEYTLVTDLRPLENLKSLRYLDIRHTEAFDVSPLSDMPELRIEKGDENT